MADPLKTYLKAVTEAHAAGNAPQRMVVALSETLRLMGEIDAAIPGWPIT